MVRRQQTGAQSGPKDLLDANPQYLLVWWCCGDESVDFNFYTKRASLAAVYGATMMYWMSDDSEENSETLSFYRLNANTKEVGKQKNHFLENLLNH